MEDTVVCLVVEVVEEDMVRILMSEVMEGMVVEEK
jgi:hypothetical protein